MGDVELTHRPMSPDTNRNRVDLTDIARSLIETHRPKGEKGLSKMVNRLLELNDTTKQRYFAHLATRKAGKEQPTYYKELAGLELTQRELIDLALAESGRTLDDLFLDGVTQAAKEAITRARGEAYRRDVLKEPSPMDKVAQAYEKLKSEGKRITMTKLTSEAEVNYRTTRQWADANPDKPIG